MRFGRPRVDMPWIETEKDEEFMEFVRSFHSATRPEIEELLEKTSGKEIVIFRSRDMAEEFLRRRFHFR